MQLRQLKAKVSGMTYFTVVITAVLIGTVLTTYLTLVSSQNQNTMRSQAWNRTVAVLEAGIEEALAHLNKNGTPDAGYSGVINLAVDGWQPKAGGGWWKSNAIGEDYYVVTITSYDLIAKSPDIIAEGYVKQQPTFTSLRKTLPFLAQVSLSQPPSGMVRRAVYCTTTNVPVFTKALVAKEWINLSGQNVRTDSFDSSTNTASSNGKYDVNKRRDNGDIAANRAITNTYSPVNIGNANIFGRVSTGPNLLNPGMPVIDVGSQGKVGSIAWQNDPLTGGKIQPGWGRDDMNMDFPNVPLPSYTMMTGGQWTDPTTGQKFTKDGVTYDLYLKKGDYVLNKNDTLQGKVYIDGDVRLVVPNGSKIAMSGSSDCIKISDTGSLKLYVDCATASIGGNGIQNPNLATNFYYFGTSNNTSLSYGGNAAFTAVFYAPSADMTMGGGGSAQVDFSGSAVVKTVKMNGNFTFHYDENLKKIGLWRGYVLTSWNEM